MEHLPGCDEQSRQQPLDYGVAEVPGPRASLLLNCVLAGMTALLPSAAVYGYVANDLGIFVMSSLAAFIAVPMSLVGRRFTRSGASWLWGLSLVTNGLSAAYFLWLLFVRVVA